MARQPPAARRQRDPERTKARILEAATAEFAAHGYAGARVSEIAARAGANKQLISYYFGGKEGLYREITERWLRAQHEAAPAQRDLPLSDLSVSFIARRPEDQEMARLLVWEGLTYDTEDPGADVRTTRMRAGVEDLRRRQAEGEIPAELDVRFFLLMTMAAATAPVALPHVARSIFGSETDPASPEFMERFADEYRKLLEALSRAGST
jgi:TetR/AcrR family transcriptional regulator